MQITFYGQLGLPLLTRREQDTPERRVEALAVQLADEGHQVTILGTSPYLSGGNYHGIELQAITSLDPEQPGGWTYLLLGLFRLITSQPGVIHVHTARAAFLLFLTRWLFPETKIIYTIDDLPRRLTSFPIPSFPFLTTTPSRALQYRLLIRHGIRAIYVPDGFTPPALPDLRPNFFNLKKGQYAILLASHPKAIRQAKQAYKKTGSKKQLVLATKLSGREKRSLIAHAAVVILADNTIPSQTVLETMNNKKAIIAVNDSRYQELLGTTAQFYKTGDSATLAQAVRQVIAKPKIQATWGQKAHQRASNHFTWQRILPEYLTAYVPQHRLIPLDSVQSFSTNVQKTTI